MSRHQPVAFVLRGESAFQLARFYEEQTRGVVHSDEWIERMTRARRDLDDRLTRMMIEEWRHIV